MRWMIPGTVAESNGCQPVTVTLPPEPPVLTPGPARALPRILAKARAMWGRAAGNRRASGDPGAFAGIDARPARYPPRSHRLAAAAPRHGGPLTARITLERISACEVQVTVTAGIRISGDLGSLLCPHDSSAGGGGRAGSAVQGFLTVEEAARCAVTPQ